MCFNEEHPEVPFFAARRPDIDQNNLFFAAQRPQPSLVAGPKLTASVLNHSIFRAPRHSLTPFISISRLVR
jgi:hypothetical protein